MLNIVMWTDTSDTEGRSDLMTRLHEPKLNEHVSELANKLSKSSENNAAVANVLGRLEEFSLNRDVLLPWNNLEIAELLKAMISHFCHPSNSPQKIYTLNSQKYLWKLCSLISNICEYSASLSSEILRKCCEDFLILAATKGIDSHSQGMILLAVSSLCEQADSSTTLNVLSSLSSYLCPIAQTILEVPLDVQHNALVILTRSVTSQEHAQECVEVWFPKWPHLQKVFLENYMRTSDEGYGNLLDACFNMSSRQKLLQPNIRISDDDDDEESELDSGINMLPDSATEEILELKQGSHDELKTSECEDTANSENFDTFSMLTVPESNPKDACFNVGSGQSEVFGQVKMLPNVTPDEIFQLKIQSHEQQNTRSEVSSGFVDTENSENSDTFSMLTPPELTTTDACFNVGSGQSEVFGQVKMLPNSAADEIFQHKTKSHDQQNTRSEVSSEFVDTEKSENSDTFSMLTPPELTTTDACFIVGSGQSEVFDQENMLPNSAANEILQLKTKSQCIGQKTTSEKVDTMSSKNSATLRPCRPYLRYLKRLPIYKRDYVRTPQGNLEFVGNIDEIFSPNRWQSFKNK